MIRKINYFLRYLITCIRVEIFIYIKFGNSKSHNIIDKFCT